MTCRGQLAVVTECRAQATTREEVGRIRFTQITDGRSRSYTEEKSAPTDLARLRKVSLRPGDKLPFPLSVSVERCDAFYSVRRVCCPLEVVS